MNRFWHIILTAMLFLMPQGQEACTAFCIRNESQIRIGKNLDWPIGEGFIMINKRGESRRSIAYGTVQEMRWVSNYGSVTFNQFGKDFPLGGMNEAGLVIEELSYSPTVYPADDNIPAITELQWIQYQLDTFGSVGEVVAHLSKMTVNKFLFGLHYFLCDGSGDVAVVEFIDGQTRVYRDKDLPVPVLTNNSYSNALKYLKLHKGFGGDMIPTNGPESPVRFVRAAQLVKEFSCCNNSSADTFAFSILEDASQQDTQWRIVYDPLNFWIRVKFREKAGTYILDMKKIDFDRDTPCQIVDLGGYLSASDLKRCMKTYSAESNKRLIRSIFDRLVGLGELDTEAAFQFKEIFTKYHGR